jgi:hypothetical protein
MSRKLMARRPLDFVDAAEMYDPIALAAWVAGRKE